MPPKPKPPQPPSPSSSEGEPPSDDEGPPSDDEAPPGDSEEDPPSGSDEDPPSSDDDEEPPPSDDEDGPPSSDGESKSDGSGSLPSDDAEDFPPSDGESETDGPPPPPPPPSRSNPAPPSISGSEPEDSGSESMSEPGSDGSDFDDEDAPPPPPKRKDNNAKPQPQDSKSAAVSKEVAQQLQSLSFGLNVSKNKKDIAANVDEFSQSSVDESKDETIDNSFESSSVEVEGDDDSEPESDPSSEEEEDGDDDKASSMNTSAGGYNVQEVQKKALEDGYISCQGRYDDDPFETMYMSVCRLQTPPQYTMEIMVPTGHVASFELVESKASVYEDPSNPTRFVLHHYDNVLIFQFDRMDELTAIMKEMPSQVFETETKKENTAPDHNALNKHSASKDAEKSAVQVAAAFTKDVMSQYLGGGVDTDRVKGSSVEDMLQGEEFDFLGTNDIFTPEQLAQLNLPDIPSYMKPPAPLDMDPNRRKEIVETYIRKPRYSARRVKLLCEWINSLHLWPSEVSIHTLYKDMCNGMLLLHILKHGNPSARFTNINERALTKHSAIENLEQALGYIWRSKSLNNSRIPAAREIYSGSTSKIAILINEYFGIYVQRPLYKNAVRILRWFHGILKQYLRPLPPAIFTEGDLSGVWPHFQSGTALFCVLYHFIGPNMVGTGEDMIRVDAFQVMEEARTVLDFSDNLKYVFKLLQAVGIHVLFTHDDWMTNPDTEFIMMQLSLIYKRFKNSQCVLPPAMGDMSGLSSGPNGEPIVAGVLFADSKPKSVRFQKNQRSTKQAVLMGHAGDTLPIPPVNAVNVVNSSLGSGKQKKNPKGNFMARAVIEIPKGMVDRRLPKEKAIAHKMYKDMGAQLNAGPAQEKTKTWGRSKDGATKEPPKWKFFAADVTKTETETLTKDDKKVKSMLKEQYVKKLVTDRTVTALANQQGSSSSSEFKTFVVTPSFAKTNMSLGQSVTKAAAQPKLVDKQAQEIFEQKKREEIESAILSLEDEMKKSQAQLDALEDELASRYIDLEAKSSVFEVHVYEALFNELEDERKDLEEEQFKLQDHFAKRLASIKLVYIDQSGGQAPLASSNAFGFGLGDSEAVELETGETNKGSPGKKGGSRVTNQRPQQEIEQSKERGWSNLTTKTDTHNFLLRNKNEASASKFHESRTPRKIKDREIKTQVQSGQTIKKTFGGMGQTYAVANWASNQGANANDTGILGSSASVFSKTSAVSNAKMVVLSAEEAARVSFAQFKGRLHNASLKWHEVKVHTGRARHQDIIANSPTKPTNKLISMPAKSFQTPSVPHSIAGESHYSHPMGLQPALEDSAVLDQALLEQELMDQSQEYIETEAYSESIQLTEMDVMEFEDQREKARLLQAKVEEGERRDYEDEMEHLNPSTPLTARTVTSFHENHHPLAASAASAHTSTVDVEVAYHILRNDTPLVLADRTAKEYLFTLFISSPSSGTPDLYSPTTLYTLEWRDMLTSSTSEHTGDSSESTVLGSILLTDIQDIVTSHEDAFSYGSKSGNSSLASRRISVKIRESVRALKNSRGRAVVVLQFESSEQCHRYHTCLETMWRFAQEMNSAL